MTIALSILSIIAYLAGAYYVFDLHKDEEVDVFADITYQKLAFFFGLMVVLFFSLLYMKVMGDEEDES
tara:strand:- start:78710 stop:78913 length:204 start_codon:yes stop_codon:yes gene_type:complete